MTGRFLGERLGEGNKVQDRSKSSADTDTDQESGRQAQGSSKASVTGVPEAE